MRQRRTKPKIALLIETSSGYGRGILRGVARYSHLHGPWSFYVLPRHYEQQLPDTNTWQATGIIARVESKTVMHAIAAAAVPVIGLDLSPPQINAMGGPHMVGDIHPDPEATARVVAEHLFDRGFKQFAFVGIRGKIWSQERLKHFVRYVSEKRGCLCSVYQLTELKRTTQYGVQHRELAAWIRKQPKPLGLMTCNDDCGREVLDAAMLAGVRVPQEMAVVGVDNDEILCDLCDPPLSSVALNSQKGGYEAAELMEAMLSGRIKNPKPILVEPVGVVTRRSSEVVAVEDPRIGEALQFIRDNAAKPIGVLDVLEQIPMGRRTFEMRFRQLLRRSVHQEIILARLEIAKKFLRETDLIIDVIAERSGFGGASHMSVSFRRELNTTPASYRKQTRIV
jgi:LacI family transcriptional regulator